MTNKPMPTEYNLAFLAQAMSIAGTSMTQAAVSFARMAGRDVIETPDSEVCEIVDAVDAIPVSDSDLRDVWNGTLKSITGIR